MQDANNNSEKPYNSVMEPMSPRALLLEIVKFFILAAVIVIPIRIFIAQPFIVSGSSMEPTFESGQYLIVDELSYYFTEPDRGDVIILRYPYSPSRFYIKRIVGLPNEIVEIENGVVTIKTASDSKGFTLDEPYVEHTRTDSSERVLGTDEYFVMGDNRLASSDSRTWGPVTRDGIIGRVLVRLFPISEAKVFPGFISTE